MNGKLIVGLIIVLAIAGGGYYWYSTQEAAPVENTATPEDVQVQDVVVGTGAQAVPGSVVSILYEGRLEDGTVFDSSEAYGNEPLVFTLGAEGLIPGFQIGVNGMREGGERIMAVPPTLAYGAQAVQDAEGNVVVPSNSTLIFTVRLVSVTEPTTSPETETE